MKNSILIYGAYGYSGKLIVEEAIRKNLRPILSGRDEAKLTQLGKEMNLPTVALSLEDKDKLVDYLKQIDVVIHCAGPFKYTAETMATACIASQTHYLDITGEMAVFEKLYSLDSAAKNANVMLMPGAGFDIVPTDCLALYLKEQLPDANQLELAFYSTSNVSRGTMNTMIESMEHGGVVRKDGKLSVVPDKIKEINFGIRKSLAVTIPWGDVFTAFYTTGIPNIEVYLRTNKKQLRLRKFSRFLALLLRLNFIKKIVKNKIKNMPVGPSKEQLANNPVYLYGKVINANQDYKEARLIVPNGYTLTAKTAVDIAIKTLNGQFKPGFQTPAKLFGSDYILGFTDHHFQLI